MAIFLSFFTIATFFPSVPPLVVIDSVVDPAADVVAPEVVASPLTATSTAAAIASAEEGAPVRAENY